MKSSEFKIIVIDDNQEIHKDFIKILTNSNAGSAEFERLESALFNDGAPTAKSQLLTEFEIDTASQGKEGFELIAKAYAEGHPYSLAFVDIRMPPGWDGIETIKRIWEIDKDIQIVICTAFSDYSWEQTVSELGECDNLLILKKPFDHIAVRQLAFALTRKWKLAQDTRDHMRSLEERVEMRTNSLQASLSITRATLDSSADGIIVIDLNGDMIDFNKKFMTMWSVDEEKIKDKKFATIIKNIEEKLVNKDEFKVINADLSAHLEKNNLSILKLKGGQTFECYTQPYTLNNKMIGRIWSFRDISARATLENELQYQATHDGLTDLANRVFLEEKLKKLIEEKVLRIRPWRYYFWI